MQITTVKDFNTRQELDSFIRVRLAEDPNTEIEVDAEEAAKLGLSNKVKVYGVRVKVKS